MARRALAATASLATGSGPRSTLVCIDTALRTMSKAAHTRPLASSDVWALLGCCDCCELTAGSAGERTSAQTPTAMAITATTKAAGPIQREDDCAAGWKDVIPRSASASGSVSGMR